MPTIVFTVAVTLVGVFASRVAAIYWQVALCIFGAAAALVLPNGAVITPSNFFLPFFIVRAWSENHGSRYARHIPAAGVWLALAVLYGIITAVFVPRFMEGEFLILTADRSSDVSKPTFQLLHPVSTNFTQSMYAIGAMCAFLAFRSLLERPGRLRHFRDAALLLGALNCAAGVINLAEFHLGLPSILAHVRTAYSIAGTRAGTGGLVRIHGTFPEASTFATFTLPLMAYSFSLWLDGIRSGYSGAVAVMSFGLLLISTSSTAYAGLVLYIAILVFSLTHRGYMRGHVPRLGLILAGTLLAIVAAGSVFVLETRFGQTLSAYFSTTLLDKGSSASGVERNVWNLHAWLAFLNSYGIGVGLGTARASSFALVMLSNLGLAGTIFYLLFLTNVFRGSPPVHSESTSTCLAAGQAVLGSLCAAVVSVTVFDLGVLFYGFAAASSVRSLAAPNDARMPWHYPAGSQREHMGSRAVL